MATAKKGNVVIEGMAKRTMMARMVVVAKNAVINTEVATGAAGVLLQMPTKGRAHHDRRVVVTDTGVVVPAAKVKMVANVDTGVVVPVAKVKMAANVDTGVVVTAAKVKMMAVNVNTEAAVVPTEAVMMMVAKKRTDEATRNEGGIRKAQGSTDHHVNAVRHAKNSSSVKLFG